MGILGTILSAGSKAASGFSIGTWVKIGAAVAFAAVIGSLYWYGQHEAGRVTELTKQTGAQAQVIADDKSNMALLMKSNQDWSRALTQYQKDAQAQAAAYAREHALREKVDAKLAEIEKQLVTDPKGAVSALNGLNDQLVCLLDHAAGGARDDCPAPAAPSPGAPAPTGP